MTLFNDDQLSQPSDITDNTKLMLPKLAELGCSKHVLAVFLEMDKAKPDHIRYLTGPVIQHASMWRDTTPDWLYPAAIAGRLRIILDEHERGVIGWQVSPAEITACIYPASMDAPLMTEYAELYLWASAQANALHKGKTVDEIWQMLGGEPVPDHWFTSATGRYAHTYRDLCRDIRARVVKAAKGCEQGKASAPRQEPARDAEQFDLFG